MKSLRWAAGSALLMVLAACEKAPEPAVPTLHEIMAGVIDPTADVIWEETGKAYGEDGRPLPGKLTGEEWAKVSAAASQMHAAADNVARNPDIVVVPPGARILDEGRVPEAVTAAQVVSYVEADRPGLARHARDLADHAQRIENAAKARDSVRALLLAEELDAVCESCHQRFWYPEQAALIEFNNERAGKTADQVISGER